MTLDRICEATTNPEALNALHACRRDHPLNNPHQWRNAFAIANQRHHEFSSAMIAWLREQAENEQRAVDRTVTTANP